MSHSESTIQSQMQLRFVQYIIYPQVLNDSINCSHSPPVKEVYQKRRTRGYGERSPIAYQIGDTR